MKGKITERTLYTELIGVINDAGGSGVSEISYESEPDIVFELGGYKWILSVKIGENIATIKSAFLQYLRHKEESKIDFGMLLIYPDSIRHTSVTQEAVIYAIKNTCATTFIDASTVKEEIRHKTFPDVLSFVKDEIINKIKVKKRKYGYSMNFVISILQQQVVELMGDISLDEEDVLDIVTDSDLLMDLGHLSENQSEDIARFLASYILLSQIMFFRFLYAAHPIIFKYPVLPISRFSIRNAFKCILEINYRPIFSIDILDNISDSYLKDTFELIWGLEIENVRYELPGRIFHELMPSRIRKMLAAFYTRPQAADILAQLSISESNLSVFDPSCGSGTILVSAYRRKLSLLKALRKLVIHTIDFVKMRYMVQI